VVAVKVVGSCFRKVALDQLLVHGPTHIDKRAVGAEMMQQGRDES